jgi:hypothetical protein
MAFPNGEEQLQIKPSLIGVPLAGADPDTPVDGLADVGLADVGLVEVCLLLDEHAPTATTIARAPTIRSRLARLVGEDGSLSFR